MQTTPQAFTDTPDRMDAGICCCSSCRLCQADLLPHDVRTGPQKIYVENDGVDLDRWMDFLPLAGWIVELSWCPYGSGSIAHYAPLCAKCFSRYHGRKTANARASKYRREAVCCTTPSRYPVCKRRAAA